MRPIRNVDRTQTPAVPDSPSYDESCEWFAANGLRCSNAAAVSVEEFEHGGVTYLCLEHYWGPFPWNREEV